MDIQTVSDSKASEKMKSFVFYLPSSVKGKIIVLLIVFSIAMGCAPIIGMVNLNSIIFGMPLLMVWGIVVMVVTIAILALAKKWGVH